MKNNLALITLFGIFCAMPAFAEGCGEHRIKFSGTQWPHHDEYIYSTMAAYNEADDKSCSGECFIRKGLVYECDNTYCSEGSAIITDTNDYVWQKGRLGKYTMFICSTNGADKWKNMGTLTNCNDIPDFVKDSSKWVSYTHMVPGSKLKVLFKTIGGKITYCYTDSTKPTVKYTEPQNVQKIIAKKGDPCTAAQLKSINAKSGVLIQVLTTKDGELQCSATECLSGMEKYNVNGALHCRTPQKKTEPKVEPTPTPTPAPTPNPDPEPINTECSAAQLSQIHATAGTLQETGICWPTECVSGRVLAMADENHDSPECVLETEVCKTGEKLVVYGEGKSAITFRECKKEEQAEETPVVPFTGDLERRIKAAQEEFENLRKNLETKKWRNKDGKFNTARLASDGVAGVVLGTTAGLITAHVVKKGQIKNGYEDIKCTIAGQTVSDWGDELTVGVR